MPYKIHKLADDKRNHTFGMVIPNGGFYWVVEMTFENHAQLTNLSNRPGYSVDYVEGDCGLFDPEGYEVDPETLEIHEISKQVINYERKKKTVRGKVAEKKVKHEDREREEVVSRAARAGLRNVEWASTQTLKSTLEQMNLPRQSSLMAQ